MSCTVNPYIAAVWQMIPYVMKAVARSPIFRSLGNANAFPARGGGGVYRRRLHPFLLHTVCGTSVLVATLCSLFFPLHRKGMKTFQSKERPAIHAFHFETL